MTEFDRLKQQKEEILARQRALGPREEWWDQNSVQCGCCSVQLVARGAGFFVNGAVVLNMGLSREEGEEEALCGYCAGEELHRLQVESDNQKQELATSEGAIRIQASQINNLIAERDALKVLLNTPEIMDFMKAVPLEAAHQRERWGSDHDAGKSAADWFWLVGYLAGKALHCAASGNEEKALHHVITTAAALANWHSAILGKTNMRPGIIPPEAT